MLIDGRIVGPDGPGIGIGWIGPPVVGVVVGFVRHAVLAALDEVPPYGPRIAEGISERVVVVVLVSGAHEAGFGALDHDVRGGFAVGPVVRVLAADVCDLHYYVCQAFFEPGLVPDGDADVGHAPSCQRVVESRRGEIKPPGVNSTLVTAIGGPRDTASCVIGVVVRVNFSWVVVCDVHDTFAKEAEWDVVRTGLIFWRGLVVCDWSLIVGEIG